MEKIAFRDEREGVAVLALDSGLNELQFAKSGRAASVKEKGIILLANGEESEWEMLGAFCRKASGTVAFYGEDFAGRSLLSLVEEAAGLSPQEAGKRRELWLRFVACTNALYKSDGARQAFAANGPASILCGEEGDILVLPPRVFADCASSLPENERFALRGCWVHPYLAGGGKEKVTAEKAFAFTLGCLALKMLTGEHPLAFLLKEISSSKEENAEKPIMEDFGALVSERRFVPASRAVWGISDEAAAALDALLLDEDAEKAISGFFNLCGDFDAFCKQALPQGGEADGGFQAFAEKLSAEKKKLKKKYLAKRVARRHWAAVAVAALCAAIVAAIASPIAESLKNRPTTAGLEPFEVVQGFYEAVGSLDQEVPSAYSSGGAAKRYEDLTSRLFVSLKMLRAYSPERAWISPAAFYSDVAEGVPVPQEMRIYGITRLRIEEEARLAETATYNVSFFIWVPTVDAETGQQTTESLGEGPLTVYACADRVTVALNEKNGRWTIAAIEGAEWEVIPVTRKEIAEDAAECAEGGASKYPFAPG